jgi:hypothetical protein
MILSVGIRNGKRNVERILNAVEGKIPEQPAPDKKKEDTDSGKA